MKNWKTSLAGLLTLAVTIAHVFLPKVVTAEVAVAASGAISGSGLLVSKDHNITGGTTVNQPNDPGTVEKSTKVTL